MFDARGLYAKRKWKIAGNANCVQIVTAQKNYGHYLSKTSQIIFDLHPGFFHMEDEKGNKLHPFKKFFKMML